MFKALKSFCGKVSMKKGEIKDINDEEIKNDLLNAGYIEEVKSDIKKIDTKVKKVEEEVKEEVEKAEEKVKEEVEAVKKPKTSSSKKKK